MKELPVLFEEKSVRRVYDEKTDTWYYSVVDVVSVLTESEDPVSYWRKLKQRLKKEGNQTVTICHGLKLTAQDGKKRKTDCLDPEGILRLVQSIPSPKAEPFKVWLAKVGVERLQEEQDPSLAVGRAVRTWRRHGRDDRWIQLRLDGVKKRNSLTDYWQAHGIKDVEYAKLTNAMYRDWSGMNAKEYKEFKGLGKKDSLREHMTDLELTLTSLSELAARDAAIAKGAEGYVENVETAHIGGAVAKDARNAYEKHVGLSAISASNYLPPSRRISSSS